MGFSVLFIYSLSAKKQILTMTRGAIVLVILTLVKTTPDPNLVFT